MVLSPGVFCTRNCGRFHTHFARVTYVPSTIICNVRALHACTMQCFENALAYFARAVSYARKVFMKSAPGLCLA
jgi:hypothetical protein